MAIKNVLPVLRHHRMLVHSEKVNYCIFTIRMIITDRPILPCLETAYLIGCGGHTIENEWKGTCTRRLLRKTGKTHCCFLMFIICLCTILQLASSFVKYLILIFLLPLIPTLYTIESFSQNVQLVAQRWLVRFF